MNIIKYDNHACLAQDMINLANKGFYSTVVLFYEDAVSLTTALISLNNNITFKYLEIADESINGYSKEYYLSLSDDLGLYIEPTFVNGRYLSSNSDYLFLSGDVNSRLINNNTKNIFEIDILTNETDSYGLQPDNPFSSCGKIIWKG